MSVRRFEPGGDKALWCRDNRSIFSPLKSFILQNYLKESLRARRLVAVDEQRRNIRQLGIFEGMSEKQREERGQNEKQQQHPAVPKNVQELFVSDAENRAQR